MNCLLDRSAFSVRFGFTQPISSAEELPEPAVKKTVTGIPLQHSTDLPNINQLVAWSLEFVAFCEWNKSIVQSSQHLLLTDDAKDDFV